MIIDTNMQAMSYELSLDKKGFAVNQKVSQLFRQSLGLQQLQRISYAGYVPLSTRRRNDASDVSILSLSDAPLLTTPTRKFGQGVWQQVKKTSP